MDLQRDIEFIDKYLNDELSDLEKKAFEDRLVEEPAFKKLLDEQQFIRDAMAGTAHLEMEEVLRNSTKEESGRKLVSFWKWAAAIIPLIALGSWWLISSNSLEATVDQFYVSPRAEIERTQNDNDLSLAMTAFGRGEFESSINYFENIPLDSPSYDQAKYYQAHALYQLGQWTDAKTIFLQLTSSDDPNLQQLGEWFAILASIKSKGDADVISGELTTIANDPNHFYQEQAQQLLEEL